MRNKTPTLQEKKQQQVKRRKRLELSKYAAKVLSNRGVDLRSS